VRLARVYASYTYLVLLAVALVVFNAFAGDLDASHPDDVFLVAFLCSGAALLNIPQAGIEQGRLSLSGIAVFASAILLNPLDATLVGLTSSVALIQRGRTPLLANAVVAATVGCLGASLAASFRSGIDTPLGSRLVVLAFSDAGDLVLVAILLRLRFGYDVRSMHRNVSASFAIAFGYLALAALLISYLLDGTALGYFLATIVCVLALALTDTISGRRVRRVLESELSDADRHLFHSRAVEGVVHNLRNHVATAVGYLKEIELHRLDPVDRESLETATAAANDAVSVLRGLSQGATPRVSYSITPVDLNELVTRALAMARPRARSKEVLLAVRESSEDVKVKADPLLMREVITNLVNNAIDAAPNNGRVELHTGRHSNGWPYFSVTDNGPGVADENRHHLFEPHFTTKEGGSGLGLFMSFGVVREHQGELMYEGSRRGAVFTVTLPPYTG
jgi:signal transduction histidine kinase